MINKLICDIGCLSINHFGEQLCGDHIEIVKNDSTTILVLADGLGSGVKANILSILTAKTLSTMIANNVAIKECVLSIAQTLPICLERNIAYSTFTIIKITDSTFVEIYNYDNPLPFAIVDGRVKNLDYSVSIIDGKRIYHTKYTASKDDLFVLMSDGVLHAGIGAKLNFGWSIKEIQSFLESLYRTSYSAKSLSTVLLDHVNRLYDEQPGDDATCAIIKIKERNAVNLLIGPASNRDDDEKMLSLFFSKAGKHIVSGGTTSNVVSRYLKMSLNYALEYSDKTIPPIAHIEGVDLVTEGVVTINKVLDNARDLLYNNNKAYFYWCYKQDGASLISKILFEEATDINFFVGCAVNPAHQDPSMKVNIAIKLQLIDELSKLLKEMGKNIKVSYF
jgi:hypothetical protein